MTTYWITEIRDKGYAVIGVGDLSDLNAKIGALPDGARARLGYKGHDRAGEALSALLAATGLLSMNGKLLWGERQGKCLGEEMGYVRGFRPVLPPSMSDGSKLWARSPKSIVCAGR
jgi:hypothetical protein